MTEVMPEAGRWPPHPKWSYDPDAIVRAWDGNTELQAHAVDGGVQLTSARMGVSVIARPGDHCWDIDGWVVPADDGAELLLAVAVATAAPSATFQLRSEHDVHDPFDVDGGIDGGLEMWALRGALRQALRMHQAAQFAELFPGGVLDRSGGAVPFQAEGSWHGHPFYFRYRHGQASLSITTEGRDPVGNPHWHASVEYGAPLDGFLMFDEFLAVFRQCADRLARSEFMFEFPPVGAPDFREMRRAAATERAARKGIAGARQARAKLMEAHQAFPPLVVRAMDLEEALIKVGLEEERSGVRYKREPVSPDDRVWPKRMPPFVAAAGT